MTNTRIDRFIAEEIGHWPEDYDSTEAEEVEKVCPQCKGTGINRKDWEEDCERCEGYGTLLISK